MLKILLRAFFYCARGFKDVHGYVLVICSGQLFAWSDKFSTSDEKMGDKGNTRNVALVLRRKQHGNDVDDSLEAIQLDEPLRCKGYQVVALDWQQTSRLQLLKAVHELQPALLVLSSYCLTGRPHFQPSLWFLHRLKQISPSSKFVGMMWDTCSKKFWKTLPTENVFDLFVAMENRLSGSMHCPANVRHKWLFQFASYAEPFPIKPLPKDIDVFFSGQIDSYRSNRAKYVERLISEGYGMHIYTSNRATQFNQSDYFEMLGRSRIVINFSFSVDMHQLKGRVFEAMLAGALLLESRNAQTESIFSNGVDYVAFDDEADLLKKIRYYLEHPEAAAAIALSGRQKTLQNYTAEHCFNNVLDSLELPRFFE